MNNLLVMLIEADVLIRAPLAAYLRDCGFRVVEASDTVEARDILAHAPVKIEAILLDADAPGEGGFVFRAWLRQNHPGVEIILAGSVEKTVSKAGELCEKGPNLSKPYAHELVLDQIRRRLGARERAEKDA